MNFSFSELSCKMAKFSFLDKRFICLYIPAIMQNINEMYYALYVVEESESVASLVM